MLIRKASKRHGEMPEIGPDHSAVAAIPICRKPADNRFDLSDEHSSDPTVREPSPYDSIIVNDDAEDRPSVGLSVVAFVTCSISGAIVGASITWAVLSAVPACH